MKKSQQGFAHMAVILLLVVVVVVMGGGYMVLNKKSEQNIETQSIVEKSATNIVANGTPTNAANAVSKQLIDEIKVDDDGFAEEDATTNSLSTTKIDTIGAAADVTKL